MLRSSLPCFPASCWVNADLFLHCLKHVCQWGHFCSVKEVCSITTAVQEDVFGYGHWKQWLQSGWLLFCAKHEKGLALMYTITFDAYGCGGCMLWVHRHWQWRYLQCNGTKMLIVTKKFSLLAKKSIYQSICAPSFFVPSHLFPVLSKT